jgi:hypothetical protein
MYLAAVLAAGDGAVLSRFAAAFLYGLTKGPPPTPEITAARHCRIPGIISHRVQLDPRDVTVCRGIPITTVPRTLVDLASHLPLAALAEACHNAEVKYRVKAAVVLASLSRRPHCPGVANLRQIFEGDFRITLSELERRFLALLASTRLPLPLTNRKTDGRYVDCRWPGVAATSSGATRTGT